MLPWSLVKAVLWYSWRISPPFVLKFKSRGWQMVQKLNKSRSACSGHTFAYLPLALLLYNVQLSLAIPFHRACDRDGFFAFKRTGWSTVPFIDSLYSNLLSLRYKLFNSLFTLFEVISSAVFIFSLREEMDSYTFARQPNQVWTFLWFKFTVFFYLPWQFWSVALTTTAVVLNMFENINFPQSFGWILCLSQLLVLGHLSVFYFQAKEAYG